MKIGLRLLVVGIFCAAPMVSFAACPQPSELKITSVSGPTSGTKVEINSDSPNKGKYIFVSGVVSGFGNIVLKKVEISTSRDKDFPMSSQRGDVLCRYSVYKTSDPDSEFLGNFSFESGALSGPSWQHNGSFSTYVVQAGKEDCFFY